MEASTEVAERPEHLDLPELQEEPITLMPKQDTFIFSGKQFCGYGGGVGNGKSMSGIIKVYNHCQEFPGAFFLIGRRHATDLRDSTLKDFLQMMRGYGHFSPGTNTFKFPNGSEVIFRHLDDLQALTNMNLSGFWVDQAEEISEEAFDYLVGRCRRQKGLTGAMITHRPKMITFNPNGRDWIWRRFYESSEEDKYRLDADGRRLANDEDYELVMATTLENRENLPDDYLKGLLAAPEEWQKRFVQGSFDTKAGRIFELWNPQVHVIWPHQYFPIPQAWERFRMVDHGQNNPTACFDDQTEVLTDSGWKLFADLLVGDRVGTMALDEQFEWQTPGGYIRKEVDEDIGYYDRGSLNFVATLNHQFVRENNPYGRAQRRKGIIKQSLEDMPDATLPLVPARPIRGIGAASVEEMRRTAGQEIFELPRVTGAGPLRRFRTKHFARFLGLWLAEGSLSNGRAGYITKISQKKSIGEVREVLDRLGWNYNEWCRADGLVQFSISSKQLYSYLSQFGKCYEKFLPREVFDWPYDCQQALWEGYVLGDGRANGKQAFTTSIRLADDFQQLLTQLGVATRVRLGRPGTKGYRPLYIIQKYPNRYGKYLKNRLERRRYQGAVYCVTVPNGTLIVRRGGRVLVCGNCLWGAVDFEGNMYLYDEYYRKTDTVTNHVRYIKDKSMIQSPGGLTPDTYRYTVIDPSSYAKTREKDNIRFSVADEYMESGIPTVGADNNVNAGIDRVNRFLQINPERRHPFLRVEDLDENHPLWKYNVGREPNEAALGSPRLFIFARCENLRREIPEYAWQPLSYANMGRSNNPEKPVKNFDHAVDAMRYGVMSRPVNPLRVEEIEPGIWEDPMRLSIYAKKMGTTVDDLIHQRFRLSGHIRKTEGGIKVQKGL